jgi:predicted SAM-dependent methyltransferase
MNNIELQQALQRYPDEMPIRSVLTWGAAFLTEQIDTVLESNEWRDDFEEEFLCLWSESEGDEPIPKKPLALDLGCGPNKHEGCIGIDHYDFEGVDIVRDLRRGLPFGDDTVDGIVAKQVLEHFDGDDLLFLIEEMWRVGKPGAPIEVVVPDASSPNGGKDFSHKKKDWDEWSFQMWEKKDGHYLIDRGPLYGIRGQFKVMSDMDYRSKDRWYRLEVIK